MKYPMIIFTILFISCTSPQNNSTRKKRIYAVLMQQQDFWNQGNVEGYMKGYYKSDSLRFASDGNVSYGWQTTLDHYLKGYPDRKSMGKLTFSNINIKILSDKAALVFGQWELQREEDHPHGLFTLIFKKTGCGWRIIHDHTSTARK